MTHTCPRTDTVMDTLPVLLRWASHGDAGCLAAIDAACYSDSWPESYFHTLLNERYAVLVAESLEGVIGYMIYLVHGKDVNLVSLTVHPDHRRRRVGYQLLARLLTALGELRCSRALYLVREGALEAQVFLRAFGFVALKTWRGHFEDTGEDGYLMAYGESAWVQFNRVARHLETKQ